jgi:hypothetical protein
MFLCLPNFNITDADFWVEASCAQVIEVLVKLAALHKVGGATGFVQTQHFPNFAAGGTLGIFVFIFAVL